MCCIHLSSTTKWNIGFQMYQWTLIFTICYKITDLWSAQILLLNNNVGYECYNIDSVLGSYKDFISLLIDKQKLNCNMKI